MKKKGFTLIELAVGTVLIGIWLTAIVNVLQYAIKLTNTTKSQVVAINLAREWIETVFNMRDTNWKMFSSKKDECWLSTQPDFSNPNCQTLPWMNAKPWVWVYYYIKSPFTNVLFFTGENVLVPTPWQLAVVENKWDDTGISSGYRMCYFGWSTGTNWYWDSCNGSTNGAFDTKYGRYWRWIEIKWLFKKDAVPWWTPLVWCTDWSQPWCNTSAAKELRFCSRVDYFFGIARRVELCSAITNFEE